MKRHRAQSFLDKKKNPKKRTSSWGRYYDHERSHYAAARRPHKVLCQDCGFVFQPGGKLTLTGSEEMAQSCKCGSRNILGLACYIEIPSKKRKKRWKRFFDKYAGKE